MNKKTILILIATVLISLTLHVYKYDSIPACLNADEASYGYNAYSILKTGRDEYGVQFPLRLKSFGDYKLPLYTYLDIPFVATLGLNDVSTRLPAAIIGILFPIVMYFLIKELFDNEKVAIVGAILISVSPWFQIISRQAHESLPATLFLSLSLILMVRFFKNGKSTLLLGIAIFIFSALFSYHISRILGLILFVYFVGKLFLENTTNSLTQSKKFIAFLVFFIPLLLFFATDLKISPDRVKALAFYNNKGFTLKIDELRSEHDIRVLHNKITQSALDLSNEYLKYFSPEFLVIHGDQNPRFGYMGVSPITAVEYLLLFAGLYFLFQKKEKNRYLIVLLLLSAPLAASLAWQEYSINRSFFMIIPITILVSYGFISLVTSMDRKKGVIIGGILGISMFFFLYYSWDFYFFHYFKRPLVTAAWQCGNKDLALYVNANYDKFDQFYITRRNGQPYIYLLFYNKYDPAYYQHQAALSTPDEFGFGQVEKFDKFNFDFTFDPHLKNTVFIGSPDEFNGTGVDISKIRVIKGGDQEVFWVYEN